MSAEVIQDTHVIVQATGDIDLTSIGEFIDTLGEAVERGPGGFIIDLTDATYMDSAGVQAIYAAYLKMDATKDRLVIVMGNIRIRSVLEVVHFEQLPGVVLCEDLDSARRRLSAGD